MATPSDRTARRRRSRAMVRCMSLCTLSSNQGATMRISVLGGIAAGALAATILLMPVEPLSTPAVAAKKVIKVKQSTVLAACKRTAGCSFDPDSQVGCSPNTCFSCYKGKCQAVIKGTKTPSGGDLGKLISSGGPPKTGAVQQPPPKAGSRGTIATPKGGVLQQSTNVVGPKSGTSGRGRPAQNRK
jgi:hypothetical protein